MAKALYYGSADADLTSVLLEKYLELKKENIFRKDIYYLVPTAEHADRIKTLALEKLNPLFSDNIATLSEFFQTGNELSELERQTIFYKICQDLDLEYFHSAKHSPAFYSGLAELFNELQDYCIDQKLFIEKLAGLNSRKARDLEKIFAEYEKYLPPENSGQNSAVALTIFIDGFSDFTPWQYAQIQKLANNPQNNIYISLTYIRPFAKQLSPVFTTLQKFGFETKEITDHQRQLSEDLRDFAVNWGTPQTSAAQNVKIISAGNRLLEIEAIAREIIQQKNQNNNWSDFALIFRSIGSYQFLINEIFSQYKIPVEVHEGIAVSANPFCSWILSLRDANSDQEILFSLLKSAYAQVDKTLIDKLEFTAAENSDCDLASALPELTAYIQNVLQKSQALQAATEFSQLRNILEKFYEENNCAKIFKSDRNNPNLKYTILQNNRSYAYLLETLDNLQKLKDKLGVSVAPENLWDLFISSLNEKTSARQRNGDQVQVYDALSARQKDYKTVFLADLTLRSWPAGATESLLLKDYEKEQLQETLKFKRRSERILNEDIIFYQAFTRAGEKVYLCLAAKEASDKKLSPSPYLNMLKKFFPDLPIIKYESPAILTDSEPLCREEYEQTAIYRFFNQPKNKETDLKFILDILAQKNDPAKLHYFTEAVKPELEKLRRFSVTQLEKYSRCALRFFYEDVLKLRGKPEDTTILTMGTLLHEVLEKYYQLPSPDLQNILEEVWNSEKFTEDLRHILPRQAQAERKKLLTILQAFIDNDIAKSEERGFQPAEFEYKLKGATVYTFGDNTLTGTIDRIDKNTAGDFLVVDYKTGALPGVKQLRTKADEDKDESELTIKILPQVLIYAFIYQEQSKLNIAGAEYASIKKKARAGLYNNANLTKPDKLVNLPALLQKIKNKTKDYFSAIQNGEFQMQNDEAYCQQYCTAGQICRKEQTGYFV